MMMTATRKSLEKLNSRSVVFAIIPTSLICVMWPNYPGTVMGYSRKNPHPHQRMASWKFSQEGGGGGGGVRRL